MIFKRRSETSQQSTGDKAEEFALTHLKKHQLTLVQQNYRCKVGEIDLVMKDGDTLVFVEVRYRKNAQYGSALDSVNLSKQGKITKAAQYFLQKKHYPSDQNARFDVVGITGNETQWIKNAF